MSTTVKTPLSEIKKELDSWFSDYLRDSEKSGNTPTETQVKKKLEEIRDLHNKLSKSDELSGNEKSIQVRYAGCFQKAINVVDECVEEYVQKNALDKKDG